MAAREFRGAADYYESESSGLGEAFLHEIDRCIQTILEYPEAAPIIAGSVRRRLMRRFPYALLYSIQPAQIRILAVMNLRRRPFYWIGRE
jgi:hypothetical protein